MKSGLRTRLQIVVFVFWSMIAFVCHLGFLLKSGFPILAIEPERPVTYGIPALSDVTLDPYRLGTTTWQLLVLVPPVKVTLVTAPIMLFLILEKPTLLYHY